MRLRKQANLKIRSRYGRGGSLSLSLCETRILRLGDWRWHFFLLNLTNFVLYLPLMMLCYDTYLQLSLLQLFVIFKSEVRNRNRFFKWIKSLLMNKIDFKSVIEINFPLNESYNCQGSQRAFSAASNNLKKCIFFGHHDRSRWHPYSDETSSPSSMMVEQQRTQSRANR